MLNHSEQSSRTIPDTGTPRPPHEPHKKHPVRNLLMTGALIGGGVAALDANNLVTTPDYLNRRPAGVTATLPDASTPELTAAPTTTEAPNPLTLEGQLPYEMAADSISEYQGSEVKMTFAVQKEVQQRTPGLKRFYLSDENLRKYGGAKYKNGMGAGELVQRMNDGILAGHLMILQQKKEADGSQPYKDLTIDGLKEMLHRGEHPSYTINSGYKGSKDGLTEPVTIDVAKPVTVIMTDKPRHLALDYNFSYGFRSINDDGQGGALVLEAYNVDFGGVKYLLSDPYKLRIHAASVASDVSGGFIAGFINPFSGNIGSHSAFTQNRAPIDNYLIPVKQGDNWASIIAIEAMPPQPTP